MPRKKLIKLDMKKLVLTFTTVLATATINAQEAEPIKKTAVEIIEGKVEAIEDVKITNWNIKGKHTLNLSQGKTTNWAGGDDTKNLGAEARIDYDLNYKKDKVIWDNRINLGYGLTAVNEDETQKSSDFLNITSTFGYELKEFWYATARASFSTQFTKGYNYKTGSTTADNLLITDFLSPAYATIGLGVDYKPSENFSAYFHPLTAKFTIVTNEKVKKAGNLYGLDNANDSFKTEFGLATGARYSIQIAKNITFDNTLDLFSSYENMSLKNVDIRYGGLINMKVNDYISANIGINAVYDNDTSSKVQFKQALGIGASYLFETNK